ncbi:uncharacterized protein IL334_003418 [Kwoniella shivajii]|uniref:Nas2 N-terminal domain-containing protein n=1 Tax=Kwoniella shivajii TaxID=564305 RepID=A0ABZ1CXI5_9TREE|nr:hypothetical protein IL334_003418 [Kwoniella shivajii]
MQELVFPPPEAPSTASLPMPRPEAYEGEPREYARALMQRKDDIEKEIASLKDVLNSHGVTPRTSLTDNEGYPRGDIDIYAIRHARSSLVRLQNDSKTVSDLLATALQDAFARPTHPNGNASSTSIPSSSQNIAAAPRQANGDSIDVDWPEKAIARVNSVAFQSPALQAGLQSNDLIYDFAGVTHLSQGGIQAIGAVVSRSEGVSLPIRILRQEQKTTLHLTPRNGWGGRGTLGCHILPV